MTIDPKTLLEITPVVRNALGVIETRGAAQLATLDELGISAAAITESSTAAAQDVFDESIQPVQAAVDALELDPENGVTSWTVPAKSFDAVQGSPTYAAVTSRLGAWHFANGVAGYVAALLKLPSHWQTMDIYIQWVNEVANNGNVVLIEGVHQWAIGESINTSPTENSQVVAANPSPFVVVETKVGSDVAVTAAKSTTLRIARNGLSGSDTLGNSISILAVRLQKKT